MRELQILLRCTCTLLQRTLRPPHTQPAAATATAAPAESPAGGDVVGDTLAGGNGVVGGDAVVDALAGGDVAVGGDGHVATA